MKNRYITIAIAITVLISAGLVYFYKQLSGPRAQIALKDQASHVKLPKLEEKEMTPGDTKPQASTVLHVNQPAVVREALKQNAWLTEVLGSPLGRGFGSGWAAFLQTKGEDLKARFSGPILDFLADKAFAQPFAIAWVSDGGATGTPAFVIDGPKSTATAAFEMLSALVTRGILTVTHCPGEQAGKEVKYRIVRWLVADQALYASVGNDRMVVAAKPTAVLQGMCLPPDTTRAGKPAVELALSPDRFGRASQLFGVLLGAHGDLRLPIEVEQNRFVPKGISGALETGGHLATAAPSDELLKLIPSDIPVAALLQLKLPKTLSGESLAKFFKDGSGEAVARQATLLWDPKGKNDVALLWSVASEKAALAEIFAGASVSWRVACGHVIMASNADFGTRIERTCKGQSPAIANAQPEVVQGAKAPQSVALHLNLGTLLSSLLVEQYKYERQSIDPKGAAMPPEIEQAKKQLETLPFFGFRGRVEGNTLVGEGFRS